MPRCPACRSRRRSRFRCPATCLAAHRGSPVSSGSPRRPACRRCHRLGPRSRLAAPRAVVAPVAVPFRPAVTRNLLRTALTAPPTDDRRTPWQTLGICPGSGRCRDGVGCRVRGCPSAAADPAATAADTASRIHPATTGPARVIAAEPDNPASGRQSCAGDTAADGRRASLHPQSDGAQESKNVAASVNQFVRSRSARRRTCPATVSSPDAGASAAGHRPGPRSGSRARGGTRTRSPAPPAPAAAPRPRRQQHRHRTRRRVPRRPPPLLRLRISAPTHRPHRTSCTRRSAPIALRTGVIPSRPRCRWRVRPRSRCPARARPDRLCVHRGRHSGARRGAEAAVERHLGEPDHRQVRTVTLKPRTDINPEGPTTLTAIVDTGSGSIMSTIFGQVTTKEKQCQFMPTIGSTVVP